MIKIEHQRHLLFSFIAILPALFFALYTNQIWEDFFIAYRHSVNWVEGDGLSYSKDQRIQGFSSPLMIFLSAAVYKFSGKMDVFHTIWG